MYDRHAVRSSGNERFLGCERGADEVDVQAGAIQYVEILRCEEWGDEYFTAMPVACAGPGELEGEVHELVVHCVVQVPAQVNQQEQEQSAYLVNQRPVDRSCTCQ